MNYQMSVAKICERFDKPGPPGDFRRATEQRALKAPLEAWFTGRCSVAVALYATAGTAKRSLLQVLARLLSNKCVIARSGAKQSPPLMAVVPWRLLRGVYPEVSKGSQ
jgi:hypothetical protein